MSRRRGEAQEKDPAQSTLEEPENHPEIQCPACVGIFSPDEVKGEYLHRVCPLCGCTLDGWTYDAAAKTLTASRAQHDEEIEELCRKEAQAQEKIDVLARWWQRPMRWAWSQWLSHLSKKRGMFELARDEYIARFGRLAGSRYYASEWYLRTRIPLRRKVVAPYKLKALYSPDGVFRIYPKDSVAAGIRAEYAAFCRLLEEACDETSPLFGAQIIPNLYLPHLEGGSFWSQVDMVALTAKAAFVVEVKARKCSVFTMEPFRVIEGDGKDRHHATDALTSTLAQNYKHARDFEVLFPEIPSDRVFEQVVFAWPKSFESDSFEFCGKVNVGCLGVEGCPDFTEAMKSKLAELDDVMTDERLRAAGEELIEWYGDLGQKRFAEHGRMLDIRGRKGKLLA